MGAMGAGRLHTPKQIKYNRRKKKDIPKILPRVKP